MSRFNFKSKFVLRSVVQKVLFRNQHQSPFYSNFSTQLSSLEKQSFDLNTTYNQFFELKNRLLLPKNYDFASQIINESANRAKSSLKYLIDQKLSNNLPPLYQKFGIISVACTRSNVLPGLLGLALGQVTLNQTKTANNQSSIFNSSSLTNNVESFTTFSLFSFLSSAVEALIILFRSFYLSLLFSPVLATAPFVGFFGPKFRKKWLWLLLHTLENAGAAFIKWGQWAATRPDLFPHDMCTQLAKLQSKAPCHSFLVTKKTIESAFQRNLEDIFDDFEEDPVASGSIAQVHRAVLKRRYPVQKSGHSSPHSKLKKEKEQVVAVKVRHPGVSNVIRRDFAIMQCFARVTNLIPALRWLRLEDSVQQFAVFMLTQVDLSREASHLSRFNYNFRRWKDVSFPVPLYPLVHPSVLVETFEQGESVSRFVDRSEPSPHINSALALIGSHTLLKMLLVDNFVHADLHPGNILVRVQRGSPAQPVRLLRGRPHVILLDVGMTAELAPRDRETMLHFFKALAKRDGKNAAKCTLKFTKKQNCPDPDAFIKAVETAFEGWKRHGDRLPTGECMQELLEQVRKHRVNIDGAVCTVMITTLVLEGWQRKLDPDLSIMDTLNSILFKSEWASSLSYTINSLMAP